MSVWTKGTQSLAASGILCALTLSVFAASQLKGPESTLRRIDEAVTSGDALVVQAHVTQKLEDPDVVEFTSFVSAANQAGLHLEVGRVEYHQRECLVHAAYVDEATNRLEPFLAYFRKDGPGWALDARGTAALNRQVRAL